MDGLSQQTIRNWSILCPGPSLSYHQHVLCDPGGLIAVNGAVLKCPGKIDWWVLMDPEVFVTVSQLIPLAQYSKNIKLWLFWNFEGMGIDTDGARWDPEIVKMYKQFGAKFWMNKDDPQEAQEKSPVIIDPFVDTQVPWNEFSMFAAISLAIKKGAQSIRLYGADLHGLGYFRGGLNNWRMRHTEKRWTREIHYLKHIKAECKMRDIQIFIISNGTKKR